MKKTMICLLVGLLFAGCASNVHFIQTNESYTPQAKPGNHEIVFKQGTIDRPHQIIGVIQAELGKKARRPELDALIINKAREIGADGVMMVEYDIDRDVYLEQYHAVVGRGPWRRHVVSTHPRHVIKKTASGIAVVFE
jgi:uncharacterized protein YceK